MSTISLQKSFSNNPYSSSSLEHPPSPNEGNNGNQLQLCLPSRIGHPTPDEGNNGNQLQPSLKSRCGHLTSSHEGNNGNQLQPYLISRIEHLTSSHEGNNGNELQLCLPSSLEHPTSPDEGNNGNQLQPSLKSRCGHFTSSHEVSNGNQPQSAIINGTLDTADNAFLEKGECHSQRRLKKNVYIISAVALASIGVLAFVLYKTYGSCAQNALKQSYQDFIDTHKSGMDLFHKMSPSEMQESIKKASYSIDGWGFAHRFAKTSAFSRPTSYSMNSEGYFKEMKNIIQFPETNLHSNSLDLDINLSAPHEKPILYKGAGTESKYEALYDTVLQEANLRRISESSRSEFFADEKFYIDIPELVNKTRGLAEPYSYEWKSIVLKEAQNCINILWMARNAETKALYYNREGFSLIPSKNCEISSAQLNRNTVIMRLICKHLIS